jgi:glutamate formiminotransferase
MKIIECVPNISEGRDRGKIELMSEAIAGASGVKLLNVCMDRDHNRTVFTFIGDPQTIVSGAIALSETALTLIDMSLHAGVHPRIGAVDVVPFVPLRDADMIDAVEVAHRFGRTFGDRNCLPVYFYGAAALRHDRRELPQIRRGGYEGLKERLADPNWAPDAGQCVFDARRGAVVVGAREPLIAFNINLVTDNAAVAWTIASEIREANGGLPCVRALGLLLESRGIAQVSMNLTNYKVTPISAVFHAVAERAAQYGTEILESELIGLIPEGAYRDAASGDFKIVDFGPDRIIENYC